MTIVGWSTRGFDGVRGRTPEAVVARVARDVTDGAIVMLHDASEHDDFEPASVRALPELLGCWTSASGGASGWIRCSNRG
jgi:hypothetical protein